ncbi:MAG: hypothetical protein JWN63_2084 [Candidatus Acidoferrum typicum]|nr:hypothetical protein [Candidatus Acidoferrum typicum]
MRNPKLLVFAAPRVNGRGNLVWTTRSFNASRNRLARAVVSVFRFASREERKHRQREERVIENTCQPPQKRNRQLS